MPVADDGARRAIAARAGDWTRLLQDLIRIPSCFEAEHAIVARVCEHVTAIGLTPVLVPMDAEALRRNPDSMEPISEVAGRNNIVVRLPGRGGGRSLILNCHLDTQPEGDPGEWTHPPFSGHIDAAGNAIFGRGAMDDKAGVAICLGLMQTLVEQRLRLDGDLVFQFVLEDEVTGNGSLACLEAGHIADAALIVDGTRPDRAIDRHAGNMEFHVALKGRPASVSVSHMGANAAEMLSRTLLDLRDAFFRLNDKRQPPWTEFPSPYQLVIHGLDADAPRFCVPVEASARCFVTFPAARHDRERAPVSRTGKRQARQSQRLPRGTRLRVGRLRCRAGVLRQRGASRTRRRRGQAPRHPGPAHRALHRNVGYAPLRQAWHSLPSLRPRARLQPAPRRRAFPAR